ncbi:hypothetical protein HPA73_01535 [Streptococcus suis]|uniref:ATP phosphoribosyltransferase regulatory subunit n=1 Tax=Streptococcus suis TaxID=1307 RepID=UPI0006991D3B|nr:ATP phosphoribosyltransferase regulatory subunit [Streptococcus suis]NRG80143.1 hypothetical protein [Streptococcus suis]CZA70139.1 histidyl-tRNA synthetase protein HisS [Streptococcus suis]CZB30509.1 histidyl-tRNA synthetase protein HisS [Streptococcus suis]
MEYKETKITGMYDLFDDEIKNINSIHQRFLKNSRKFGFEQIQTSLIEQADRYLKATKVHPSKIFEVHRMKEKSKYVLQADLAMSISRFVSDLSTQVPLKFIQTGLLFRDRIPSYSGYRRMFYQTLIGVWGIESSIADVEVIYLTWKTLIELKDIKVNYILISNTGILEVISPGLSEYLRFSNRDISSAMSKIDIEKRDGEKIIELFQFDKILYSNLSFYYSQIKDEPIKLEIKKVIQLCELLSKYIEDCPIYFSLSNLYGTGHYSGMNYKIFITDPTGSCYDIADGGRIDAMTSKFNKVNIPGVCMGIGTTVLSQFLNLEERESRYVILIPIDDVENTYILWREIMTYLCISNFSILPCSFKKRKKIINNEFYIDDTFILVNENSNFKIISSKLDSSDIEQLMQKIEKKKKEMKVTENK